MEPNNQLKAVLNLIAAQNKFCPSTVEKEYYSNVIINNIQALLDDRWKVLLKGGAAISKVYLNHYRLGHDLDFVVYPKTWLAINKRTLRAQIIASIRDNMENFFQVTQLKRGDLNDKISYNQNLFTFYVQYFSLFNGRQGSIKVHIFIDQMPLDEPDYHVIRHFYQDPLTGKDLIPSRRMLVLSFNELVAEKLRCAVLREDISVRDYYDLGHIAESGFDFYEDRFIKTFRMKLMEFFYCRNYQNNFGLSNAKLDQLNKRKKEDLTPYIRTDEEFSVDKLFKRFNQILSDKRFHLGFKEYYQPLAARVFTRSWERLAERMPC